MAEDELPANLRRLSHLWWGALVSGFLVAITSGVLWQLPSRWEWVPAIISLALGAAVFGGLFFIACNLAGIKFEARVSDETRIRGETVEHVTHVSQTGEKETDKWLSRYVFARNLFGGLIIPLAILAGLFIFS